MKKILVVTSTDSKKHNSGLAFRGVIQHLKNCDLTTFICDKENYKSCKGCGYCISQGKCIHKDRLSHILHKDYTDIIFISPVYFFTLKSDVMKVLERFYCCGILDTNLHLFLMSGSSGRYGGIDIIKEQFKRTDEYSGSNTTIFNVVTNDNIVIRKKDILDFLKTIEGWDI